MKKRKHFGAISLNSVLILVVSLTAFVAMIISTFLLFARFNKIVIESAQTTTEQAVKNVSKSVDTFVDNMLESLYNIEKIVNEKTDKTDITDSLNTLLNLRSDLVDIILYDKEGNIIECISNEKYPIKPNATEKNLSFDASVFSNPTEYQISQPHVNNIFSKY
ncbi:MAG: hypothetical protein RRZ69_02530, partial [Clostridia bacterium]